MGYLDTVIGLYNDARTSLVNKVFDLASNTLTGTRAQFNTAMSDDDFATLAGTETLSNKTLVLVVLGTPASGVLTNCTGLPIASIVGDIVTALKAGTIELGHATDTTLSRSAAGKIAVEGVDLVDLSSAQALTNKTLTTAKFNVLKDTNGNTIIGMSPTGSAVNYPQFTNAATGNAPTVAAEGSDSNISLTITPKGTGVINIKSAQTGQAVTLTAVGPSTDHDISLVPKGAGVLKSGSNPVGVKVAVPASASATGVVGQWAADASFHYMCIAANTWVRSAAATW